MRHRLLLIAVLGLVLASLSVVSGCGKGVAVETEGGWDDGAAGGDSWDPGDDDHQDDAGDDGQDDDWVDFDDGGDYADDFDDYDDGGF